ncbi:flavin-containing monooxygenase [Arundinibacter roseus]|uniref:Flavin-containing monooxygenase 5 n=1 Tax=Arundinibacter roseus TaxID=2070510 RepID=A0A4R4KL05_9BACT|nr:NAD(P)-binding domain-containing protein [Arundinibacter roseus]TDB68994.1 NAD(P)/FAD-dependent oxidoreductase [Arundinibacter roseus]
MEHEEKKVCIVGAGASGISAAKTLKEYGISFDCFEKGSQIGGNWRYNNDNGRSSAYNSLHINTNRDIMGYSDYPLPRGLPMFPHHSQIIQYFDNYVDHFGLRKLIRFQTSVEELLHQPDGRWLVRTDQGDQYLYDYVIVANGHHWNPRYPDPPFPGLFTGDVLHSHHYRVPEQIQGKDLLLVGIGNSAVDIACEVARLHKGRVTISSRSGAYIVPNWIMGKPLDSLANPLTARLPLFMQRLLLKTTLFLARGNQEAYGVPTPQRPILSEHPTLSQDLLTLAGRGLIEFKPNIKAFQEKEVYFEDGSHAAYDQIVYATGYKISFPFLKEPIFTNSEENDIRLYKKVVHPNYPNLFFQGLIQPLGAIMPLAEVQAIWIARLISGECRLPTREQMQQEISQDAKKVQKRYNPSPRHTLQVDFYPYKAGIEREMKKMRV